MVTEDAADNQKGVPEDFRIEEWLIQPQLNRITINGQSTQVQPKIMGVLLCMAEQPGRVVTKEQLFKTVWAGTHVSEHVLSRSISQLRKIFNDRPQQPRVIETIPKVGYRLIVSVLKEMKEPADNSREQAASSTPVSASHVINRLHATRLWVGVGAIVLIALIVVLLLTTRSPEHVHMHLHQ